MNINRETQDVLRTEPIEGIKRSKPESKGRWKKRKGNRRDDEIYLTEQQRRQEINDKSIVREVKINAMVEAGKLSPSRRGGQELEVMEPLSIHDQGVEDGKWKKPRRRRGIWKRLRKMRKRKKVA